MSHKISELICSSEFHETFYLFDLIFWYTIIYLTLLNKIIVLQKRNKINFWISFTFFPTSPILKFFFAMTPYNLAEYYLVFKVLTKLLLTKKVAEQQLLKYQLAI
ncbi:hypothetical protein CK556_00230 [Mesoplasma chauliocola]|uniref:Uncharacterized protein n=1 Tax=Mesoplasma chauliocola TaxID=216427 RepID=A0A249SM75_9MOLU|nr:hypothetical protein CK556_00230 [Mesoplasma chauliocola]